MNDTAQSSPDQGKNSTNKYEWREVSREYHELASTLEKSHTLNSSNNCAENERQDDEARTLLKQMQINLEEAQARSAATELKVCGRFDEYMRTWDEDRGRPNFIMDTIWQLLQSNDTKTFNVTEDF